ncbi:MAG TPA: amino acid adenylation domain-containing protein, partial [Longimicrobiaceae bacterium]
CAHRSVEQVVGMLAVHKAGGVYLPLDPSYPAERLAFMLADAAAPVLLTREALLERLPEHAARVVCLDRDAAEVARGSSHAPEVRVSPEELFYVTYTSGTTGLPKGTEVPHRAVAGFFWDVDHLRYDARQVLLQHSSPSWDASLMEYWPALLRGGRCVLYPGASPEPVVMAGEVRAHGVTTLWLTSAFFNLVVDAHPEVLEGVEQVVTGGEALSAAHVRRALERFPRLRLINGYGPSECTVFAACWPVPAGFEGATVPLGRPIGDRRVYVLDRWSGALPWGVPGELCVGGPAVARGYLGRPELTAAKFVPDPFAGEPGARMYRSGDRVRWRADGTLEFLGRTDAQVKVRGFRVEPGEVEAVLAEHPEVREAVVTAREDGSGSRALVAYVVGGGAEPAELRAWLRERLPEYMVPSAVVALEALPLTPHGKTDRRALPAPDLADAEAYVAPRTPTEELLAGIWEEVLGAERVGAHAHFFDLGGHSLLATRVVSRVRGAFGVELPLRALFEAPTVAGLAARVEGLLRDGGEGEAPPLVPVPRDGPLPLSFAQQRLWFIDRLEPGSPAYNMPFPLRLRGALDARALERSLAEVVRRHEALRTRFDAVGGEPVQVVDPAGPVALPLRDLRGLPEPARAAEVRRLAAEEALRPFDLERGPLLRAVLVRLADEEHALLFTLHHVVFDGWSMGVLTREVSAAYAAFAEGRAPSLPELPVQYADYAAWQRGWLRGETLERHLAWWRERLGDAPPLLEIPTDRPRPPAPAERGASRAFRLDPRVTAALAALARAEGATPFMVLLAGFQLLLGRYAGEEDVVVGTPVAGRSRAEMEPLIGFFVNTLALRVDLGGDPTVRALLGRVREGVLGAFAHQEVPFERLVEELAPERSLAHTPLFQSVFALQNQERGELRMGSLEAEPLDGGAETARFDLRLAMAEAEGGMEGSLLYRSDLFDAATAERLVGHLSMLLAEMAADPDRPLSALPAATPAERERMLVEWNATAVAWPQGACVHDLFAAQAARTPGAAAVVSGREVLTYAELDRRTVRLARRLRGLGAGPDARVALLLERDAELPVGVLGILRAGAAYVPLDPGWPDERLARTLADAGAPVLVTQAALAARVPSFAGRTVRLDADREELERESAEPLESGAGPDTLAYVIYTSGSTG